MSNSIPEDVLTKAQKALDKAKIELMSSPNMGFISTVCFSMRCLWTMDLPTAATNGRSIWLNPVTYLALTERQRVSRLLHETWHVALMHLDRQSTRDQHKWNVACDYYINLMLTDAGYERIPTWLWDVQYRDMSSEQIYAALPPDIELPETERDLEEPADDSEAKALQAHLDQVLIRAAIVSASCNDRPGTVPGAVQTYLDKLLNPVLPWNRILLKHMHGLSKTNYSWQRPNRRFFPDHHLPSLYGESLDEIAAFVDISGSVSDQDFKQTVSEVHAILRQFRPRLIHFGQFDTCIQSMTPIKTVKALMETEFTGRGGTLIGPVIDWVAEHKPKLTLIFSDGGFRHSRKDPGTPVVWLIHNNPNFTAPFGKVVHYDM